MTIESPIFQKQVSPDIYPVGSDAIISVVKPLFESDEDQTWDEYLALKEPILEVENPYANGYLLALSNCLSGLDNEGFRIGITLAYEIFKDRAKDKQLPTLTLEFVQAYDFSRVQRMSVVYNSKDELINGANKEEEIRRGLFVMLEKNAYETLEQEMILDDESIFENTVFSGFVASYFLFREGFSDHDNWEK